MAGQISKQVAALFLATASLVGCRSFEGAPAPTFDADADLAAIETSTSSVAVQQCLATGSLSARAVSTNLAGRTVQVQTVPLLPGSFQECRNRIVNARRYAIDVRFTQFEQEFFAQNRWTGLGSTVAALGLNLAASLSPAGTAQALSAAAGGVTGTRAAYSDEVLAKQTLPALHAAMHAQRDLIWVSIRNGLTKSVAEYPLEAALSDMQAYYRAGTVLGALTRVTEITGVQAAAARDALLNPLPLTRTDAAAYLQSLIEAGPEQSKAVNEARIRAEMQKLGLSDRMTVSRFVRFGQPADIETAAVSLGFPGGSAERRSAPRPVSQNVPARPPVSLDREDAGTTAPGQDPRIFLRQRIDSGDEVAVRREMTKLHVSERTTTRAFAAIGDQTVVEAVARNLGWKTSAP